MSAEPEPRPPAVAVVTAAAQGGGSGFRVALADLAAEAVVLDVDAGLHVADNAERAFLAPRDERGFS